MLKSTNRQKGNMKMKSIWIAVLLLIVVVSPTLQSTAFGQTEENPVRILLLQSYHIEFPWDAQIRQGVLAGLAENGYEVDQDTVMLDEFYMDTKRNSSPEYFTQIAETAIAYIRETLPDVVIVSDDNATRLVVQPMRDEGIPFVVVGLNAEPEDLELAGSPNVAGVLERPHLDEMLAWIEQVFGRDTRLSFLAEDTETSQAMFGDGRIRETVEASPIEFVDITLTNDYELWQEHVLSIDETSDVLFLGAYASLRDATGEPVEAVNALTWTVNNSPVPVVNFWEEAVHLGALGGAVISGDNQGHEAAVLATKILDGTPPDEIGFNVPARGKLIINRDAMERWDVRLPINLLELSEIVGSEPKSS